MPITKPTPITKWPNNSHAYLCPDNKPSIGNHQNLVTRCLVIKPKLSH